MGQLRCFGQIRLTSLELLLRQFVLDRDASEVRDLVDDLLIAGWAGGARDNTLRSVAIDFALSYAGIWVTA